MKCPSCESDDTLVRDSRALDAGTAIRRRRFCDKCGARFTTIERIAPRELKVIKINGTIQDFDRDKIFRSIAIASKKRPISDEQIETIVNNVIYELAKMQESKIQSSLIGKLVLKQLEKIDHVAYIRFASVYMNCEEVEDFEKILKQIINI